MAGAADLFWRHVRRTETCWLWEGARGTDGYGMLEQAGRRKRAHRVAWELTFGPPPPELDVCHRCDVRNCVNPTHLFLGTRAENTRDRDVKGRTARGERHGSARLTRDQVLEIRAAREAGSSSDDLAQRYGVGGATVRAIVAKTTWRWLS